MSVKTKDKYKKSLSRAVPRRLVQAAVAAVRWDAAATG
jgi:hypothetical protein